MLLYKGVLIMVENFSLHYFKVFHKNRTILEINLSNDLHIARNDLLSSVVIGANGTGKSYLLATIVEFFMAIDDLRKKRRSQLRYDSYTATYSIGRGFYSITIKSNKIDYITVNNQQVSINDVLLPQKIMAISYMLNDKFPFRENVHSEGEMYEYLGIRNSRTAAYTNSLSEKISDVFLGKLNDGTIMKIKDILSFLDFESKLTMVFVPEFSYLFSRTISYKDISDRFNKLKSSKYENRESNEELGKKEIIDLVTFLNRTIKAREKVYYNKYQSVSYTIDLNTPSFMSSLSEDSNHLIKLIKLKLIKTPKIILYKNNEKFEIEDASSGEKHMLFTLINIASKIEENSIVLIDEPDLSLHPNWQMKYIKSVKNIFKEYASCHFILATHSHYLVSDLEPESSSLVVLKSNENSGRSFELLNINTYAWSAENILYNIFNVRTTRNYYFEMNLREILELIGNKSDNYLRIKSLLEPIKKVVLDENDPLNLIIKDVERYLSNETN